MSENATKKKPPRAKGTGSIFKPKGSSFYWIAYVSGGKRRYESTKSNRIGVAQSLLTDRLGDIGKGIVVTPQIGKLALADGLKAVVDNQRKNGRQSADASERRIESHLLAYFSPERRMNTITTGDVERYQTHRLNEKAKNATINRELAILRRAFRLAKRGGDLLAIPDVPMLREDNVRQGFLEQDQFEAILTHLPDDLHPALRFMYTTGWRKSEVFGLTADRVDLGAGVVRLEPGTTKSGDGRTFYVTAALQKLLKAQLASIEALKKTGTITPFVFHRADGSQIKEFRRRWTAACEAAGYRRLLHDFRRSAVRNMGNNLLDTCWPLSDTPLMVVSTWPKTLQQAVVYFADPAIAHAEMVKFRWPDGVVRCPTCGSDKVWFTASRRVWQCVEKHPRRQFSVKVGSIMEDSPLGIDKWLMAIWLITNCKNGISSYELGRDLGITQKSAWFMLHRIRLSMQAEDGGTIGGDVEVDETFIGGKSRNMHHSKRERVIKGTGGKGKVAVMGLLARHSERGRSKVRTSVQTKGLHRAALQGEVRKHVEPGSNVYTDAFRSYIGLDADYVHGVIDHAEAYVNGQVHTNGLENFWSLVKRALKGTYVSVEPFHLFRYLDEQCFRFNQRCMTDAERFVMTAMSAFGRRLTFKQLTAADETC